mgnify:CR=1 FL=1
MDIVERIRQLCARNDISIAALERQLNFGNGTIGRWSTASPTVERLGKVADYFGVSVDYLTGREQQETLDNLYLSCLRRAQSQGIDPRDLELAVNTILQLRKQDGIKHEPNQKESRTLSGCGSAPPSAQPAGALHFRSGI